MKKHFSMLIALAALLCLATAFGCGTTTDSTTQNTTTNTTTMQTTTAEATTKQTETESIDSTTDAQTFGESSSDPMATLPDIDNPITDIEPNIPESGVGDNGGIDDLFDGSHEGSSGNDTAGGNGSENGAHGRGRNTPSMPFSPKR